MNNTFKAHILLLTVLVFLHVPDFACGQVSGSNSLEYQTGNLPGTEPGNRSSLYNQLNLNYRQGKLSGGVRAEVFNVDQSENSYTHISQKYIRYKTRIVSRRRKQLKYSTGPVWR